MDNKKLELYDIFLVIPIKILWIFLGKLKVKRKKTFMLTF